MYLPSILRWPRWREKSGITPAPANGTAGCSRCNSSRPRRSHADRPPAATTRAAPPRGPREGRRPLGPGHRYRDRWGLPGDPQGNGQSDGGTRLHTDRRGISTVEATCSAEAATRQAERRGVGAPAVWVRAGAYAPEVSPSDPCGGTREVRRLPSGGHGQRGRPGPRCMCALVDGALRDVLSGQKLPV